MKYIRSILTFLTAALFAVTAAAGDIQPMSFPNVTTVTAEELLDLVDSEDNLVIVDSRTRGDYDKGHIPDVAYLINTETNADSLAKILASKDTPVCFYCNGPKCARSGEAAQIAVEAGYSRVYWLRGGIAEWTEKGYPIEQ
ncbi:rhodanese-like domain-containing protein [Motiliproteus sediminis]|uniref:rhodanese-like domain-containing protein n=1 Tax=Motiliproteus sediminis TaxID=1468178 RepID=UPI001AEF82CB|nr:rhodanese-like domain-containing protein [Motiliproteus sediminis]